MIRDVGEDLERGRVYLPEEDLDRFGVTRARLARDVAAAVVVGAGAGADPVRVRAGAARTTVPRCPGSPCSSRGRGSRIRAATLLYGGILDGVRRGGYEVLAGRIRVSRRRRALLVACAASDRLFAARTAAWFMGELS